MSSRFVTAQEIMELLAANSNPNNLSPSIFATRSSLGPPSGGDVSDQSTHNNTDIVDHQTNSNVPSITSNPTETTSVSLNSSFASVCEQLSPLHPPIYSNEAEITIEASYFDAEENPYETTRWDAKKYQSQFQESDTEEEEEDLIISDDDDNILSTSDAKLKEFVEATTKNLQLPDRGIFDQPVLRRESVGSLAPPTPHVTPIDSTADIITRYQEDQKWENSNLSLLSPRQAEYAQLTPQRESAVNNLRRSRSLSPRKDSIPDQITKVNSVSSEVKSSPRITDAQDRFKWKKISVNSTNSNSSSSVSTASGFGAKKGSKVKKFKKSLEAIDIRGQRSSLSITTAKHRKDDEDNANLLQTRNRSMSQSSTNFNKSSSILTMHSIKRDSRSSSAASFLDLTNAPPKPPNLSLVIDPNISLKIYEIIKSAIAVGVPEFNEGRILTCLSIYNNAINQVADLAQGTEIAHLFNTTIYIASLQPPINACWILRFGFDVFIKTLNRASAKKLVLIDIHTACENGLTEQVKILSCLSSHVYSWKDTFLPIHIACYFGQTELVDILLDAGSPVNEPTKNQYLTPLHLAAACGSNNICRLLLANGAHINAVAGGRGNSTPLTMACENGHFRTTKLLLRRGADISARTTQMSNDDGKENDIAPAGPLDVSLLKKHYLVFFELLKQENADIYYEHSNLKELEITQSIFETFPEPICKLIYIEKLSLINNLFTTCSQYISSLQNLVQLDLSYNRLLAFPSGITMITSLRILHLNNNQLFDIPGSIGNLENLEVLMLNSNSLESLPAEMSKLKNLKKLNIENNPLVTIPKEVISRGTTRLFQYLEELQYQMMEWKKIKLMVIGEEGVGKTSLLRALMRKSFSTTKKISDNAGKLLRRASPSTPSVDRKRSDMLGGTPVSTDGIDISEWVFDDVVFSTWDFAGQQVFYPTHQFFLTSRSIYIIVFSACNFDNTANARVQYWLRQIKAITRDRPPIFLVGTHIDDKICTPNYLNELKDTLNSCFVPQAWNIQGYLFVCTKKDKEKGIRNLAKELKSIALKQKMLQQKVPNSYVILEKLIERNRHKNTASWDEYKRWALECSIQEEAVLPATLFLHDVGTLVYFDDVATGLNDLVILKPQWLVDVMSSLITHKHQWIKDGILQANDLKIVWKDYDVALHSRLLALLAKFRVIHPLPGDSQFMVPSLLPQERPTSMLLDWPPTPMQNQIQFGRMYRFSFSFDFGRMIVAVLHVSSLKPLHYWRTGMLVSFKVHQLALIQWNQPQLSLSIQMRADEESFRTTGDFSLLRQLIEMTESILEGFYPGRSTVERMVPCSHCIAGGEAHTVGAFLFPLEDLVSKITQRKAFVYCRGVPTRPINIRYLAPDITFDDCPILEDIEIEREIGKGGFGVVYKGTYNNLDVAVKELQSTHEGGDKQDQLAKFNEFQREVYIMSWLDHPNLVKLYGVCLHPLRMVMEWCGAGDVYRMIERARMGLETCEWRLRFRITLDVAKGMRYLQGITPPIIHRDLRSPNVFLMSTNPDAEVVAKVADFGLSREVEAEVGGMLPTWRWLAPEVISADSTSYDERADIYSFGIFCWELATLRIPFDDLDEKLREVQIKQKICDENLRPTLTDEDKKQINPVYLELIQKCWSKDPANRPSFGQCVSLLSALTGRLEEDHENLSRHRFAGVMNESNTSLLDYPTQNVRIEAPSDRIYSLNRKFQVHDNSTVYRMIVVGQRVWLAHDNGQISVWDLEAKKKVHIFSSSDSRVESMIVVPGYVWIASSIILIYDSISFKLVKTLKGAHSQIIRAMTLVTNEKGCTVWSGDTNGVIQIWDPMTYGIVSKIKLEEPVFAIAQAGDRVWVGQYRSLLLLNSKAYNIEGTCIINRISSLVYLKGYLWGSSNDNKIHVWNAQTGTLDHQLEGHTGKVTCMAVVGDLVWSGSFDKSILIWDSSTFKCVEEIANQHDDTITCILRVHDTVWTSSKSTFVCEWSKIEEAKRNFDYIVWAI